MPDRPAPGDLAPPTGPGIPSPLALIRLLAALGVTLCLLYPVAS